VVIQSVNNMETRKLYDLTYKITSKKEEESYELPTPILQISLINENRSIVGFLPTVPTETIEIEVLPETVPVLISILQKLNFDLEKEEEAVRSKVDKQNSKDIKITVFLREGMTTESFELFEMELIELLSKYGFTGRIENFATGNVFNFPIEQKEVNYKI